MNQLDISIVLTTYNRSGTLRKVLESLICQETNGKFSYEILVVDDGSTDETRAVVEKISGRSRLPVRYLREKGSGYPHAMNRGVKESCGKWVAFFDDDQLASADWLKELFDVSVDTGAHLVGGSRVLEMSEVKLSMLGPECRALCGEVLSFTKGRRWHSKVLPGGGNLLIMRSVFDSIGFFDIARPAAGMDIELCLRARIAGFNICWAPKAMSRHMISSHRLEPDFLKRYSIQWGCGFAYTDWKHRGLWRTNLACIARIGQALLINLPLLILGYIRRSRSEILDRKILLWRAAGYTRMTLFLLAPRLFPQKRFFHQSDFRQLER